MPEKTIIDLMRLVKNERGLDLTGYKETFLTRRLNSRFRVLGLKGIDPYCRYLEEHQEEFTKLIDVLAINVTEFFRDLSVFEIFANKILPELVEARSNSNSKLVRILSAGGATGEEAYSIAIILKEVLGKRMDEVIPAIMLVDIDYDALKKAKNALYSEDRLKNVSSDLRAKYFTREGEFLKVKPEIRSMVRVSRLDLLTGRIPKFFDVVFCRNVMIYFSKDAHSELFMKLYSSLVMDGFLILGRTETLLGTNKSLFDTYDSKERIYRKRSTYSVSCDSS